MGGRNEPRSCNPRFGGPGTGMGASTLHDESSMPTGILSPWGGLLLFLHESGFVGRGKCGLDLFLERFSRRLGGRNSVPGVGAHGRTRFCGARLMGAELTGEVSVHGSAQGRRRTPL